MAYRILLVAFSIQATDISIIFSLGISNENINSSFIEQNECSIEF
ncbi:hypothetical protein [Gracilibacillus thailandensis]|nr:hypothetical protein [Gracilibacillus thailandensis]